LPPVVVGLALYLVLFALVHRSTALLWSRYGDLARIDGASMIRSIVELFKLGRATLLAFLAAFGRAIAEVGAIIIVGGIRGFTRTMTTTIIRRIMMPRLGLSR
jgi:tungstate transport system permease protein